MNVKGEVVLVLPEATGTGAKGVWVKRGYVVETTGQYPKRVQITVFGTEIRTLNVGDVVDFSIELESREYQGRWYNDIKGWKVEILQAAPTGSGKQYVKPEPKKEAHPAEINGDGPDDLPF